jgi:hypothetical protein
MASDMLICVPLLTVSGEVVVLEEAAVSKRHSPNPEKITNSCVCIDFRKRSIAIKG